MSPTFTDITEKELEAIIVQSLLDQGYTLGDPKDYDKDHTGYARLRKIWRQCSW
jgi:hypothetical protein